MNTTCWIGSRTTGDGETDGETEGDLAPGADGVLEFEGAADPVQAARSAATTPLRTHGKGHPRLCIATSSPDRPGKAGIFEDA
jgi:hypothetical protein